MFDQILPLRADNTYRGYKLALWLFAVVVFMKAAIGLNSIFNGHKVAISADGIPSTPSRPRAHGRWYPFSRFWGSRIL